MRISAPSGEVLNLAERVSLQNHLRSQAGHLDYPTRRAEGRSLGSGQAEGTCKNMIGRRLRRTWAR